MPRPVAMVWITQPLDISGFGVESVLRVSRGCGGKALAALLQGAAVANWWNRSQFLVVNATRCARTPMRLFIVVEEETGEH